MSDPIVTDGRRPRIGLLISRLDRGFHRAAWLSVAETARRHGVDAICCNGGVLCGDEGFSRADNALYDLIGAETLDGLLVWSSCLDWSVGPQGMQAFCDRFRPLPLVSIGRSLSGFPSVLVDNYQGMREAVLHLVDIHGFRRIAFLRGPVGNYEEVLRYQGYVDVLSERGIPLDLDLVSAHTNWERADGATMIRVFLDERRLRPGSDFQALVAVGDDMACGALEALAARGVRVPDDVAVVGFNDDQEGRAIIPSLTTVRQPVEQLGRRATEALLTMLSGGRVPEQIVLPLAPIIRQSCGCLSPAVLQAAARSSDEQPTVMVAGNRATLREGIGRDMAQALGAEGDRLDTSSLARIVDALWGDLNVQGSDGPRSGGAGAFLSALNAALRQVLAAGGDVSAWQAALSMLRQQFLSEFSDVDQVRDAENLLHQARLLISETEAQAWRYQRFRAEQDARRLSEASEAMAAAADLNSLIALMAQELPRAGVKRCYLSLYADPDTPADWARFMLCYNQDGRVALDRGGTRFPSRQLIPSALWPQGEALSLVALPLYFRAHSLGFVLFEMAEWALAGSETLRQQISSALEGALLRENLNRAWQQAEEANRLKSRFLATVSHELRTPLSLIVGITEMLQREGPADTVRLESYQKDLHRIRTSAQHLSRLIGDVLDLASSQVGELRLSCEPLDVETLLRKVAPLGEMLALEKGLVWAAEIPDGLPLVWVDRTRLQQVILNLISNAVKFTDQGFISLWAETGRHQVMVAVSDTGIGIPPAEQDLIFDEFHQTERSSRRGYGGMGLGLAVSKRLVELHGGCLGVISSGSDGTGSTFFFTLPILQRGEEAKPAAEYRSDTVLLLTERAASGVRLQEHLVSRGYEVETLAIAGEPNWLSQVLMAPPGAIVLDLEPGAEHGWELMQTLKLNPATCDIPVLFCTLADEGGKGSLLALDYLAKPVNRDALVHALGRQGVVDTTGKPPTILVVEDDPDIQELHVRIVRSHVPGCRVLRASNGAEALTVMSATVPDLVLLDLMMPQVDGFVVLERMREDRRTRSVPVIVLTAQILTREDMARLQQGVTAVLGKELFTEAEVLNQVEAALTRNRHLGGEAQRIARLAMSYIHEHYTEAISREKLAAEVGVSERHLTLCFRQETGITPVVYLNRYRIRQARALLETTSLNVTEVAMACGFGDSTYFGKVFRQEVGVAPRAFQQGRRAEPGAAS